MELKTSHLYRMTYYSLVYRLFQIAFYVALGSHFGMTSHYFGLKQLQRHEGFRAIVYLCTAGKRTIGYGRNIDDNPITEQELKDLNIDTSEHLIVTKEQGEQLLINDLKKYIHAVDTSFPDVMQLLNEPRKWVLYNMAYNIGISRLRKFLGMLSAILQGNFIKASMEMLDSKWATQVGRRAQELSLQMKSGEWQNG